MFEAALTSQLIDLGWKADAYSRAGIPLHRGIDLPAETATVHTNHSPQGHRSVTTFPSNTRLDMLGVPVTLADLLSP